MTRANRTSWSRLYAPASLVAAAVLCWLVVFVTAGVPYLDQWSLLRLPREYPTFDDGVLSRLLGEVMTLIFKGNLVAANAALRGVATTLYLIAAFGLATTILSRRSQVLLLVALLASGYPLLWLSSELLAGAFLCLALWFMVSRKPEVAVAIALVAFGFAKPDLLFPAVVIVAAYSIVTPDGRLLFIGSFCLATFALVVPGIVAHGAAFFGTDRSFLSFGQHYAALISAQHHESFSDPALGPWVNWRAYVQRDFPGAETVLQAVRTSPAHYGMFVWLSVNWGLRNAVKTFTFWCFLVTIRLILAIRRTHPLTRSEAWYLVALVGLIPEVLLSAPHVRYLAKYAPLVFLMSLTLVDSVKASTMRLLALSLAVAGALYSSTRLVVSFESYRADVNAASKYSQVTPGNPPDSTSPFFWFPD